LGMLVILHFIPTVFVYKYHHDYLPDLIEYNNSIEYYNNSVENIHETQCYINNTIAVNYDCSVIVTLCSVPNCEYNNITLGGVILQNVCNNVENMTFAFNMINFVCYYYANSHSLDFQFESLAWRYDFNRDLLLAKIHDAEITYDVSLICLTFVTNPVVWFGIAANSKKLHKNLVAVIFVVFLISSAYAIYTGSVLYKYNSLYKPPYDQ
jgi:hypothetical protein